MSEYPEKQTELDSETEPDSLGQVPSEGALFGIDFGTKRIGIAISNHEQTISMPLENYTLRKQDLDDEWLRQLARG